MDIHKLNKEQTTEINNSMKKIQKELGRPLTNNIIKEMIPQIREIEDILLRIEQITEKKLEILKIEEKYKHLEEIEKQLK